MYTSQRTGFTCAVCNSFFFKLLHKYDVNVYVLILNSIFYSGLRVYRCTHCKSAILSAVYAII